MMYRIKLIIGLVSYVSFICSLSAQVGTQPLEDIQILSKNTPDGVILRWAPMSPQIWVMGNENGYTLERGRQEGNNVVWTPVGTGNYKPWPMEDWRPIVNEDKPYCAAAVMCIHVEGKESPEGIIKQAEDLQNRHAFSLLAADFDADAATASGLRTTIGNQDLEATNIFRIYTTNGQASSDTSFIAVLKDQKYQPVKIDTLLAEEQDRSIVLTWPNTRDGIAYTGYYIERADDGSNFQKLNEKPFLNVTTNLIEDIEVVTYIDSLAQNYKEYTYRVIGVDPFADLGPYSDEVIAMGRDRTPPPIPYDLAVAQNQEDKLDITWEWQGDEEIEGFKIYRSFDPDDNFTLLSDGTLKPSRRSFTDNTPDRRFTNYYYVVAVDKDGNEGKSLVTFGFTKDSTPPNAPTALRAEIDSDGIVLLEWDAPTDDDVRGYQVFYSYDPDSEFAVKSGDLIDSTYFVDKVQIRSLTEEIYYYVVAFDWSYNESQGSEIYKLKKPDITPPSPSIFKDYNVEVGGIQIDWIKSTSDDVATIVMERKSKGQDWTEVSGFDMMSQRYIDQDIIEGTTYTYRLKTLDDDGLVTYSDGELRLKARKPFFIDSVSKLKAKDIGRSVELAWSYTKSTDYFFIIYKEIEGIKRTIGKVKGETVYIDNNITSDQTVIYTVKVEGPDGRESKMSEEVTVTVK